LAALTQLQRFYPNNPNMLVTIGQYAADSDQHELAADVLRSALTKEPTWTSRVLAVIDRHPELNAFAVLPQQPETLRLAVPHLLRDVTKNQQILNVAMKELHCETCSTKATRSRCEDLSGDVAYALARYQDAFDDYREALSYDASNANLRVKLITRLREQGHRRDAFQEARQARAALPDDERFSALIESMTKADQDDLMQRN
jgi:tetratricopeptide (TPR) repeat protein